MNEPSFLAEVREFYDELAVDYVDRMSSYLDDRPVDRAMLAAFAELVGPGRSVLDIGCGPGRLTAHLVSLGLDCRGIDLSATMVALARAAWPEHRFDVGSMTELAADDGSSDGILCWYSLIHVPPEARAGVLAEFRRVLRPGGHALFAFQVGDDVLDVAAPDGRPSSTGSRLALGFHRIRPETLAAQLDACGFTRVCMAVRESAGHESTPQSFLIVRRDQRQL